MRMAVLSPSHLVINTVVADEGWAPDQSDLPGHYAVASATADIGDLYAGGVFSKPPPPVLPPPTTEELIAYASAKRFEVETAGVTVGGAPIRTDEKSQNRVSGAAQLVANDPTLLVIDWEAQPGVWVEVSAAQMKTIGIAVGRHVQACFSTLKAVQAAINSRAITTTAEIDAADWPG